MLTIAQGLQVKIQLQFDGLGDKPLAVQDWLNAHYPHVECDCRRGPGLIVTLELPSNNLDEAGWRPAFHAATDPQYVAMEILTECFTALHCPPSKLVSVHVTS